MRAGHSFVVKHEEREGEYAHNTMLYEDRKGEPFCFVGGKNGPPKNLRGWIDTGKKHTTADRIWLLVEKRDGTIEPTWALKKNIGPIRSINRTYWEAILAGCPDIELKMNCLAVDLAECQVQSFQPAAVYMEKRFKESVETLDKMGSKAKVRRIKHEPQPQLAGAKRGAESDPERGDAMEMDELPDREGFFSL